MFHTRQVTSLRTMLKTPLIQIGFSKADVRPTTHLSELQRIRISSVAYRPRALAPVTDPAPPLPLLFVQSPCLAVQPDRYAVRQPLEIEVRFGSESARAIGYAHGIGQLTSVVQAG